MKKYKQGMENGEMPEKDSNPEMRRRDWMKWIVVGGGLVGLGLGGQQYIKYNPQQFEKFCNNMVRWINHAKEYIPFHGNVDLVENIQERIARYQKELEELVKYATPISTFEELDKVRRNLRGNYKLVDDILCPKGHNWEPIGDSEKPFTGSLNGQGHTIYELRAEWPQRDGVGMFGYTEYVHGIGSITNLRLEDVNTKGRSSAGKLVGHFLRTLIFNCHTKGNIFGELAVGGIAGASQFGILLGNSDKGKVEGKSWIGGLLGNNAGGYVVNCLPNEYVQKDEVNCKGSLIGFNCSPEMASDDYSPHIINSPGTIGLDTNPKN